MTKIPDFPHEKCYKNKDGSHCIKHEYIEEYAEQLLEHYNPELLKTPQQIDWTDFLEYLGLNIDFANIAKHTDGEDILGTCCFDDLVPLPIYNEKKERTEVKELNTGDVVLNSILEQQPQRLLFTALHEGGHWVLHKPYYFGMLQAKGQMSLFGEADKVIKCCRKSDIEPKGKHNLVTTEDFLENQANVFAAAVAVPKKVVKKLVPTLFKKYNYYKLKDGESENALERFSKRCDIISELAALFGVSKQVIDIRLAQLGLWYENEETLQQQLLDNFFSTAETC